MEKFAFNSKSIHSTRDVVLSTSDAFYMQIANMYLYRYQMSDCFKSSVSRRRCACISRPLGSCSLFVRMHSSTLCTNSVSQRWVASRRPAVRANAIERICKWSLRIEKYHGIHDDGQKSATANTSATRRHATNENSSPEDRAPNRHIGKKNTLNDDAATPVK